MDSFLSSPVGILALTLAQTLALLVPLLIAVAYLTYAERKVLAAMQYRRGPNVVGPFGLLIGAMTGGAERARKVLDDAAKVAAQAIYLHIRCQVEL